MSAPPEHGSTGSTRSSLLLRIQADEPGAWSRLVDLYGPLVYHWCRRHGVDDADAADVFQEVFSAVAKSVGAFTQQRNGGTFRGWLWTITRNKIRDFHRQRAKGIEAVGGTHAQQRLEDLPDRLSEDNLDDDDRSETASLFHRALELVRCEFEQRTWQAFWQVAVEGHSTADVAAELGITANGVRQAKSRILRRLRQELGDP